MTDLLSESGPWLNQIQPLVRPTEILLPVNMGVGSVWDHQNKRGGWYAYLDIPPGGESWWRECTHIHATQDEAWACAEGLARSVAVSRLTQPEGSES